MSPDKLSGSKVRLRAADANEARAVQERFSHARTVKSLYVASPSATNEGPAEECRFFIITSVEDDRVVGSCGFVIHRDFGGNSAARAEFTITFHHSSWSEGRVAEAMLLAWELALEDLRLDDVCLYTLDTNFRMRLSLEKLGVPMTQQQEKVIDGVNYRLLTFRLLRSEWPRVKQLLQDSLAPAPSLQSSQS